MHQIKTPQLESEALSVMADADRKSDWKSKIRA
jgi:hypothetical protein